ELREDLASRTGLQVERHAALVAGEERDAEAERIARRGDDQDVHAEIGEERRAERTRELAREVEHPEAAERRCGHVFGHVPRLLPEAARPGPEYDERRPELPTHRAAQPSTRRFPRFPTPTAAHP